MVDFDRTGQDRTGQDRTGQDRTLSSKGNKRPLVETLWTGGWDSTFRIVELSRQEVIVQPVYIYGEQRTEIIDIRQSEKYEIAAIKRIREALIKRPETKAEILEVKFVDKSKIPENKTITEAWKRVNKLSRLGTQYEWISRYALSNPGLEIGVEYGDPNTSYANCALRKYGKLEETGSLSRFRLDKANSNADVVAVLGNLTFPIINIREVEMKSKIEEWGYEDIMKMIWFCHSPIKGKPCGLCRPCNEKIESDMSHLLPPEAMRRNRLSKKYGSLYKNYIRLMRATFWRTR